jgi:hypothetical protein
VTAKDQLIDLVETLDEIEAADVLNLLAARYGKPPKVERRLPAFVGMGHSGRGDLGRRAKDILRDELGGHAT